jgi:hypothetical protein
MSAITNLDTNTVGFDKLAAAASALKGSIETHEMIQGEIQQMMKELQPHLGQNIDVEV